MAQPGTARCRAARQVRCARWTRVRLPWELPGSRRSGDRLPRCVSWARRTGRFLPWWAAPAGHGARQLPRDVPWAGRTTIRAVVGSARRPGHQSAGAGWTFAGPELAGPRSAPAGVALPQRIPWAGRASGRSALGSGFPEPRSASRPRALARRAAPVGPRAGAVGLGPTTASAVGLGSFAVGRSPGRAVVATARLGGTDPELLGNPGGAGVGSVFPANGILGLRGLGAPGGTALETRSYQFTPNC